MSTQEASIRFESIYMKVTYFHGDVILDVERMGVIQVDHLAAGAAKDRLELNGTPWNKLRKRLCRCRIMNVNELKMH